MLTCVRKLHYGSICTNIKVAPNYLFAVSFRQEDWTCDAFKLIPELQSVFDYAVELDYDPEETVVSWFHPYLKNG